MREALEESGCLLIALVALSGQTQIPRAMNLRSE
jgi:hypothetical protein